MAVATDAKRREAPAPVRRLRLINGRFMTCPRCRKEQDVLRYVPMGIIKEYAAETNPIYKCPSCRWVFSPALTMDEIRAIAATQTEEASD